MCRHSFRKNMWPIPISAYHSKNGSPPAPKWASSPCFTASSRIATGCPLMLSNDYSKSCRCDYRPRPCVSRRSSSRHNRSSSRWTPRARSPRRRFSASWIDTEPESGFFLPCPSNSKCRIRIGLPSFRNSPQPCKASVSVIPTADQNRHRSTEHRGFTRACIDRFPLPV